MIKNIKKIVCFLIAVTLVVAFCICAVAENGLTITVGTLDKQLNVQAGDEIVVPVYLTGDTGVYSYTLKYTYDSSVLELQFDKMQSSLGRGDYRCLINDFTLNDKGGELISVSLHSGKSDLTQNGVIFYLMFKVKDNAKSGFYKIAVDYKKGNVCNYKAQTLTPAKVNGGVYVKGVEPDISSDVSASSQPQGTSSQNGAPSSENKKPIGYVPMDTLPEKAEDYYNATQSVQQNTASQPNQKDDTSSITQLTPSSSQAVESDDVQSTPQDVPILKGQIVSKKTVVIVALVGAVIIAAAVVMYIITNKKGR